MSRAPWLAIRQPLTARRRAILTAASFAVPLLLWAALSYLPFLWHPYVEVTDPGSLRDYPAGTLLEKAVFQSENARAARRPTRSISRRRTRLGTRSTALSSPRRDCPASPGCTRACGAACR